MIGEYYKKEVHSLRRHLRKAAKSDDKKSIHRLRVAIKKLKVLFRLLERASHGKISAREYMHDLKPVFKSAGHIREAQLNGDNFSRLRLKGKTAQAYSSYLGKKEKKAKKAFRKAAAHAGAELQPKIGKQGAAAGKEFGRISRQAVNEAFEQIRILQAAGNNPVIIHRIRKHVKTLSVIAEISRKAGTGARLKRVLAFGEKYGALLGNWHDQEVLAGSMDHFLKKARVESDGQLRRFVEMIRVMKHNNALLFEELKKQLLPELGHLYSRFGRH